MIKDSKRLTAFDRAGRFKRNFPGDFRGMASRGDEVIVICRSGNRSSVIANLLTEQAGYAKVYNVTHGISRWIQEGNPITR